MKDKLNAFLPIIQLFGFADNRQEKASALAANKDDLEASEKSGIHRFLKYVPANTSLMYVSTHVINLICRLAKIYLESSDKATSKSKRDLENHSDQALYKCYASIHELAANYETLAPEWGLNIHDGTTAAFYTTDTKWVIKISLANAENAKTKLTELLKSFDNIVVRDDLIGANSWMIVSQNALTEVSLAAHFTDSELTLSLLFDTAEVVSQLNALLKAASKPISMGSLDKLNEQTSSFAFLNHVKLLDQALNASTDVSKLLSMFNKNSSSKLCTDELKTIAQAFPRLTLNTQDDGQTFQRHVDLDIKNNDIIVDLTSIIGKRLKLDTVQSLGTLCVPLDIGKTLEVFTKWGKAIHQTPYSCDDLGFINDIATLLLNLSPILDSKLFEFIHDISGLGLSLDAYGLHKDMPDIKALAYVLGAKLVDAVPSLKTMLSHKFPPLKDLKSEKNVVSALNLSPSIGIPLVLQTQFTNSGLMMAVGEEIDISQLSKMKAQTGQTLIDLSIDYNLLHSIDERFDKGFINSLRLSVSKDGLKLTNIGTFSS